MTPEELLNKMSYDSKTQREEAKKYIMLKGIVQYQRVINYFNAKELPKYTIVSSLYKYDKRLRDNLYIYIATLEEYLRACIGNKFEDNELELVKTLNFEKKQNKYHSVSLTLEQLTLGELINMVLKNKSVFKNDYNLNIFAKNLNALRVLRNKVNHNNFLLAETYADCFVDGVKDNSLKHNINNLKYLLPSEFRQGFVNSINNCAKGLTLLGREILI